MNKIMLMLMFASTVYANGPIKPISSITPGAIDHSATVRKICVPGYSKSVRNVSKKTKDEVFQKYGIDPNQDQYEVDHLISLELGGSNDIKNLWPESYTTTPFNAHKKDVLENKLHKMVCSKEITLEQAQKEISTDWVKSYHDHVLKH